MGTVEVATSILMLIAGIGVFLVACTMMSTNLEAVSSNKLKQMFARTARNRWLGVGIGALATAAIQSSGATTVMVIGFVNAGILTLFQAATIIYGANIGTTITGQIVALGLSGGSSLSTTVIFSAFAGVGAFMMMFRKTDTGQKIGGIITGFGMLFVGLNMMSSSMSSFAELQSVIDFLAKINNVFLLVLIGMIMTAIIQSSSVMTSVAITMVVAGLINLDQGIYLTMGSNIGSCVVAIIAGFTSSKNAKRTALIHLLFNITGVVIFLCVGFIMQGVTGGSLTFGTIFQDLFPSRPQLQLAMFHTFFNVITVLLVLPFTDNLVNLVCRILPDEPGDEEEIESEPHLYYLDEHMLRTPAIAVQQTKREIENMAKLAMRNFSESMDMICTMDFSYEKRFRSNEKELNFLNRELVRYVVRLSSSSLSEKDHNYLGTTFHTITDLERIGDYAENIVEYADSLRNSNEQFSPDAISEIQEMKSDIQDLYENVMECYDKQDFNKLATVNAIEDEVDRLSLAMERNHIERLNQGICTANVGAQYLSLSANAERVADHFVNIAKTIKQY